MSRSIEGGIVASWAPLMLKPNARLASGIAFDVMLDTQVLISPLPIWEEDWEHPDQYSNPRLLENIRREGVAL